MGSDYTLRSRRTSRPLTRRTAVYAVVAPLAVVFLVVGLFRNHTELPSTVRQLSSGLTDPQDAYGSYSINSIQQTSGSPPAPCPPCVQNPTSNLADSQHTPLNLSQSVDPRGNSTGLAAQALGTTGEVLPSLFLFTGVLSGRGYRHRRLAVREAWANKAQIPGVSVARFILSEDERTPQVTKEVDQHSDIVFVNHKTNYKSILFKTYYVLEYAVTNFDVKFVLKTDDDAFINIAPLMSQLHLLCITEECRNERIYMGRMAKESEVLLQPGHKWNNIIFHNHTGLRTYPTYAMGGGYVLSGDVANMLVTVNLKMKLKFTPIEDATLGFWLMSMDLRHIDHRRFHTWAAPCCFKPPMRREGQRVVTRFMLQEDIEDDLCSDDPWLVLHKIDSPTKMRFVGNKVAQCDPSTLNSSKLAPSIAHYVGAEGAADAEAEEKEMQQAALAALAAAAEGADSSEGTAERPPPAPSKHKLSADLPAAAVAAAAAGQHLDGQAVEDKTVLDDKSAAQKLSEQIVEQVKLGASGLDSATAAEQQTADEAIAGHDGQAAGQVQSAEEKVTKASGEAQAAEQAGARPGNEAKAAEQAQDNEQAQKVEQAQAVKQTEDVVALHEADQDHPMDQVQAAEQVAVVDPTALQDASLLQQQQQQPQQQTGIITSDKLLQQQLASQSQQAQTM
ncbi:hypothetical protein WJX77_012346 [Trebouxia sp. C0004]